MPRYSSDERDRCCSGVIQHHCADTTPTGGDSRWHRHLLRVQALQAKERSLQHEMFLLHGDGRDQARDDLPGNVSQPSFKISGVVLQFLKIRCEPCALFRIYERGRESPNLGV